MRAIWNGTVIAESDDIVTVENNAYFPATAVDARYLQPSRHVTHCPWKGEAHYHTIAVGDDVNRDAAWFYPDPKPAAAEIRSRVAFWKGVQVVA